MVCKFVKEGSDSKCMVKNIMYESECKSCQEQAPRTPELDETQQGKDTKLNESNKIVAYRYVGESSRTLSERATDHWEDAIKLKKGSYIATQRSRLHLSSSSG